jgi:DNA processing protein
MVMWEGRSYEAVLALVLSGLVPARKIARFLRSASGDEIRRIRTDELADRLRLPGTLADTLKPWTAEARDLCRRTECAGGGMVSLADADYPVLLKEAPGAPPLLFYRGSLSHAGPRAAAVVGSRRASLGGMRMASNLAKELAGRGFTVVSGLARGIDTAAHKGALEVGGPTAAVLGSGLDVMYPPENSALCDTISRSGLVLTEFPPGTAPLRQNFPMRNRIISGLSLGTIVVEAGEASGALITARSALEQNRSVFAVPGTPGYAGSRGTNWLLKQGAKLVESIEDVLEEIGPQVAGTRPGGGDRSAAVCVLSPAEEDLMEILSDAPSHVDEICRFLNLSSGEVLNLLLVLETKGLVTSMPGKFYIKNASV